MKKCVLWMLLAGAVLSITCASGASNEFTIVLASPNVGQHGHDLSANRERWSH